MFPEYESREKILKKIVEKVYGSILDLATGSGYLVRNFISKDISVVCTDIDCKALLSLKKEIKKFNYVCCSIEALPFKDRSFDFVIGWSALVHVKNWKKAIIEALRVSNKLIIAEPNNKLSLLAFRDFKINFKAPSIDDIVEFCMKNNLKVEREDFELITILTVVK